MATDTALKTNSPFEALHIRVAQEYAGNRSSMSPEARRRGIIALMLASYFAAQASPRLEAIGAFQEALEEVAQRHPSRQLLDGYFMDVSRAPTRYGVIVEHGNSPVSPFDMLAGLGPEELTQQQLLVAEKLLVFEVGAIPEVNLRK